MKKQGLLIHNLSDMPTDASLIVETLLSSDVQNDGTGFLEVIDKVLNGAEDRLEFIGNVCNWILGKSEQQYTTL